MNKSASIQDTLKPIVSLCKRRGFIYPGSEIYGGFANTYSFGPYGAELKKNVKDLWWKMFVHERRDMVGLDGPILLHPKTWAASGHVEGFNDALIDCKACKGRFRCDHLIGERIFAYRIIDQRAARQRDELREKIVKRPAGTRRQD